jgi:hypothetical protein
VSRYKKIDQRMWGDEKFRRLSRPKPNAQSLWLYLLTGPHTTALPGLSVAGPAGLAEALGWPVKDFTGVFEELTALGMAFIDPAARVLWIPNGVKYDPPENPNVVKHWAKLFDAIPECDLKATALARLKCFIDGMAEPFVQAFRDSFANSLPNPSGNPLRNPSGNGSVNHSADGCGKGMPIPEPEPEPEPEPSPPKGRARDADANFKVFWTHYPRKQNKRKAFEAWKKLKPDEGLLREILDAIESQKRTRQWQKDDGDRIPYPATWLNERRWEDEVSGQGEAAKQHVLTPEELRNWRPQ